METTYTTQGSVRGGCGHKHRTISAALACRDRDQAEIRRHVGGGAYSDREVVAVEGGQIRPLDDDEAALLDDLEQIAYDDAR